jgi:hypothetical protein
MINIKLEAKFNVNLAEVLWALISLAQLLS